MLSHFPRRSWDRAPARHAVHPRQPLAARQPRPAVRLVPGVLGVPAAEPGRRSQESAWASDAGPTPPDAHRVARQGRHVLRGPPTTRPYR